MMVPNYARWFRGEGIVATCEKGKELDLDSLCFVGHFIVTPRQYVGIGNGHMDEWAAMTYMTAVTDMQGWKPILTQAVCVMPYRPPIQQAKLEADTTALGVAFSDATPVFSWPDGSPMLPDNTTRAWERLVASLGLQGVRLHDARHTHASVMLAQGVHPKIVQERLGHSTIAVTLDTYSHVAPGLQAAALAFDEMLAPDTQAEKAPA